MSSSNAPKKNLVDIGQLEAKMAKFDIEPTVYHARHIRLVNSDEFGEFAEIIVVLGNENADVLVHKDALRLFAKEVMEQVGDA